MPSGISKLTGLPVSGMSGKKLSEEHKKKLLKANLGRKNSEETKKKMSEIAKRNGNKPSFKGYHHSDETKKKISLKFKGKHTKHNCGYKHYLWKGGTRTENKIIRKSIEFRLWREAVFARDNWTCQECGKRGEELHPHHIKLFSEFPELRFAIDNGITLCKSCHINKHKK